MMKYAVLSLLTYLTAVCACAQESGLMTPTWHQGVVELRDGKQLKGRLFYDFTKEILQVDNRTRIQSYTSTQVAHFVFLGDSSTKDTHFYSFPFDGKGSKMKPFSFYELVHQNGVVALLSRHEYIYKEKRIGIQDPMNMGFDHDQIATEKIKEILYLTTAQVGILKYGTLVKDKNAFLKPGYSSPTHYRDPRGPTLEGVTNREADDKYSISKKALEQVMTDQYEVVMQYADTQNLKPNRMAELTRMLDYYAELKK